jgi:hypothetical protein
MANLLGQNIGTNYKGILNLNTLNGNLSGTLQAVTDGDGNASPLTLSTGEVGISRTIALGAGSSNVRLINETYTINNSGAQTGVLTGIFLNATETALDGMTHNLMDLQVGGVSQFRISKTDATIYATNYNISASVYLGTAIAVSGSGGVKVGDSRIRSDADGILTLLNDAANSFGLLKLGGTTNAFPALKRSGTTLLVRYADDSGYGYFESNAINITHNEGDAALRFIKSGANQFSFEHDTARLYIYNATTTKSVFNISNNGSIVIGGINNDAGASALFQMDSTTKGFLPPRGTNTQMLAIASPATGLIFYDTTNNKLNVYDGTTWQPCW